MKRCRQWTLLVAFIAASYLAGGVGNGQDDESADQKPAEAQIQQAQKKRLNQQEKIQALHNSMVELENRRTELAKSKGKKSNEVAALTAKMERIKKHAGALQQNAKLAALSKSESAAKNSPPAKVTSEVNQILRKHGINLNHKGAQVQVREGTNGETIVEIREQDHADEPHVIADHLPLGSSLNIAQVRARGDRPRSLTVEGRPIEFARNRQPDLGPPSGDGPGPMEAIRRLRVLEERLNQIEHKLDAILERLGQRGQGSSNARSDRRPRPKNAQQNRVRANNDRPQDRPSPSDDRARQRRQGPPEGDDFQIRRPQRPDAPPPPPGRDEFAPPPRGDGWDANNDSRTDRGPRPQDTQQDRRRVNNDRPQDRPSPPDDRAQQRRQGPPDRDDNQMRRPQRPDAPPPLGRDDFAPPPRGDGPDADNDDDNRMRRPRNPDEAPPPRDDEPPR